MQQEKLIVEEYLNAFKDDWIICEQIYGRSNLSGKQKRIDSVISSKEYNNLVFGIEFKKEKLSGFTNFTHWVKQAIQYSQCQWDGYGQLPILVAPQIRYYEKDDLQFAIIRLLGDFGIGEIKKTWNNNYQIRYKDTRIWDKNYGYNLIATKMNFLQYLEL